MKVEGPMSKPQMRLWLGLRLLGALFLYLLAFGTSASAQFTQYTPPGTFHESRETTDLILQRNMDEARWKAGRVLLDPWSRLASCRL